MLGITFEPPVARAWLLSGGMSVLLEMFLQDPLSIAGTGIITARITQVGWCRLTLSNHR